MSNYNLNAQVAFSFCTSKIFRIGDSSLEGGNGRPPTSTTPTTSTTYTASGPRVLILKFLDQSILHIKNNPFISLSPFVFQPCEGWI